MTAGRTLIFIPTYNEHENVQRLFREITALGLGADVLVMDDNSPDGTGKILDDLAADHTHLRVLHRTGKLGVGSAHLEGLRYAYDQGYDTLITMDCDFTHSPTDIPRLLEVSKSADVAVGSRFLRRGSLPGWTVMRRFLTLLGHFLTKHLLGLPFDATGAFRVYNLRRIPRELFDLVQSRSYGFFVESLFMAARNGFSVAELPIVLPARTYGHSKMSLHEAARSGRLLFHLCLENTLNPGRFRLTRPLAFDPQLVDPQGWDPYWHRKQDAAGWLYEFIATVYRRLVIKRNLEHALAREFPRGAALLHAGCGSGQVDEDLRDRFRITALDISPRALQFYAQNNPRAHAVLHASILNLPLPDQSFDGVYNLGVLEHFAADEIPLIFNEVRRILRPGGKLLVFWPHRRAPSVLVLKVAHFVLHRLVGRREALHPPEPSLLPHRRTAQAALRAAGFEMTRYTFGVRDGWIQAIVVGTKPDYTGQIVRQRTQPAQVLAPVSDAAAPALSGPHLAPPGYPHPVAATLADGRPKYPEPPKRS